MTTELLLKFEFFASHSLSVRETPHLHLWRLEVVLSGEPQAGMIVNLPELRSAFEATIAPLSQTFLNDNARLDDSAKATPTCETLSAYFFHTFEDILTHRFHSHNPTLKLKSVQVAICEPNGFEWGAARLTKTT